MVSWYIHIISWLNSNLSEKHKFKVFSASIDIKKDIVEVFAIPIDKLNGYTPYCITTCSFTTGTVASFVSIDGDPYQVRLSVYSKKDALGVQLRATIMYVKK